jgi:tRNA (guanine-N7-)-methyltransferase
VIAPPLRRFLDDSNDPHRSRHPAWPEVDLDPGPGRPRNDPVPWRAVFGNDRPVEVEIGCGRGRFLCAAAAREPEHNFFGLEQGAGLTHLASAAIHTAALANARVIRCDARCVVHHLIADGSVAVYHLYFPDPWWKRRHRKRRLCTPAFAHDLARTLIPDGQVLVATDVPGLFAAIARAFAEADLIPATTAEFDPDTRFAVRCRTIERPIHRAVFMHAQPRTTDSPGPANDGPQPAQVDVLRPS